jgi:hypothetical protein
MTLNVSELSALYARTLEFYPEYHYPLSAPIAVSSLLAENEYVVTLENGHSLVLFIVKDSVSNETFAVADC